MRVLVSLSHNSFHAPALAFTLPIIALSTSPILKYHPCYAMISVHVGFTRVWEKEKGRLWSCVVQTEAIPKDQQENL